MAERPIQEFIDWLPDMWIETMCGEYDGAGDKEWDSKLACNRVVVVLRQAYEEFEATPNTGSPNEGAGV